MSLVSHKYYEELNLIKYEHTSAIESGIKNLYELLYYHNNYRKIWILIDQYDAVTN